MSDPADQVEATGVERSTAKGDVTVHELSRTQQTVARRVAESKATVPDMTLGAEADLEACAQHVGAELDHVDLVVKAAALALREVPEANASFRDHRQERYSRINVGFSVFTDDELWVPTLHDADARPVRELAAERRELTEKVRAGTIRAPELANATFTVVDLSELGARHGASVVIPPQAGILTLGAPERRAVVRGDQVVARTVADLTLTCDHRILYGRPAARLLARIVELLADPPVLLG